MSESDPPTHILMLYISYTKVVVVALLRVATLA